MTKRGNVLVCLSIVVGMLLSLFVITGGASAQDPIRWTCSSGWAAALPHHQTVVNWAERIERLSGGRLLIRVHEGGELVEPFEGRDAVRTGAVDVAHDWAGFYMASDARLALLSNARGTLDPAGYLSWILAGGGLEFKQDLEIFDGVVVLFGGVLPPEAGFWSMKPIDTVEDLRGLKFRGVIHQNDMLEQLGVSPVFLPPGEILPALHRGVVDAAEFSTPATDYAAGFHEVGQYYYFPGLHQYVQIQEILINQARWEELPADLQEIVIAAGKLQIAEDYTQWWQDDLDAIERIREAGVEVRQLSPDIQNTMMNLFMETYEGYAEEDPRFAEVHESKKNFLRRYLRYLDLQTVHWEDRDMWLERWDAESDL